MLQSYDIRTLDQAVLEKTEMRDVYMLKGFLHDDWLMKIAQEVKSLGQNLQIGHRTFSFNGVAWNGGGGGNLFKHIGEYISDRQLSVVLRNLSQEIHSLNTGNTNPISGTATQKPPFLSLMWTSKDMKGITGDHTDHKCMGGIAFAFLLEGKKTWIFRPSGAPSVEIIQKPGQCIMLANSVHLNTTHSVITTEPSLAIRIGTVRLNRCNMAIGEVRAAF